MILMGADTKAASESLDNIGLAYMKAQSLALPERPYVDPTQAPCSYCPMKDHCYEGFEQQVEGGDIGSCVVIDEMADRLSHHRALRLASDKEEKTVKEDIIRRMISTGIKTNEGEAWSVHVYLGKNNNPLLKVTGRKE